MLNPQPQAQNQLAPFIELEDDNLLEAVAEHLAEVEAEGRQE